MLSDIVVGAEFLAVLVVVLTAWIVWLNRRGPR
jgi:hypothetical protein